jgi:hypothetical protein
MVTAVTITATIVAAAVVNAAVTTHIGYEGLDKLTRVGEWSFTGSYSRKTL